jgi:hypothetical protein
LAEEEEANELAGAASVTTSLAAYKEGPQLDIRFVVDLMDGNAFDLAQEAHSDPEAKLKVVVSRAGTHVVPVDMVSFFERERSWAKTCFVRVSW